MLIVPYNYSTRFRREMKRWLRKGHLLGVISLGSGIATLVGVVFGGFEKNAPLALYCLVALAMILMSHYCRAYFVEREESKRVRNTYEHFHAIAESIRSTVRKVHDSVHGRAPEIETQEWANNFVEVFRLEAEKICNSILSLMKNLGYPIDRVCLKSFAPDTDTLHAIARSGKQDINEPRDKSEAAKDNPFFRLLMEVQAHYHSHVQDAPLQALTQNRLNDGLRFLAIGGIGDPKLPRVLSQIMSGYVKSHGAKPEDQLREDEIRCALSMRTKGSYYSCLGLMISSKIEAGPGLKVEDIRGFIGLDSHRKDAWDFLNPSHLHALASVADSLYCMVAFYQEAQKIIERSATTVCEVV